MGDVSDSKELQVEKIVAGGDGLCRMTAGGPVVFVPFVLPGEIVRADLREEKSGFARGELAEVIRPAPERTAPPCPYFGRCGGCDLQHMSYREQLRQKLEIFRDAFSRVGRMKLVSLSIVPCRPFAYRNRVQFHTTDSGDIGFMAHRSNDVVPVERCLIAVPEINDFLALYRKGEKRPAASLRRFTVLGHRGDRLVEGEKNTLSFELLGKQFRLAAGSFAQSNFSMLRMLVRWVCDGLDGEAAADLYGGVGLFSLFLRDRFRTVHLVESDEGAVRLAMENLAGAGRHGAGRVEVHPARAEDWLSGAGRQVALDAVVVDPPRQGLSGRVRELLAARRIRRLVYVSCDPVTLARDCAALVAAGYHPGECVLFDFYPQTAHIEAVVRLSWQEGEG